MKKNFNRNNTIIFNATNIGYKLNGIGTYSLRIIKELTKLNTELKFVVYLNRSSKIHFNGINFRGNFILNWTTGLISPDKKFFGHLLRLIYSNFISIKHWGYLQFNTSPLEVSFFKKNQIVTVHDVIPLLFKQYHKKQYHFYKLLKYVLRNVKLVITPSNYTRKSVIENYGLDGEKIQVSYLGAAKDFNKTPFEAAQRPPYILYIGRINKMKNIERLLKAFMIVNKQEKINLIVIGDKEYAFASFLDELNCSDKMREKISFMMHVSEEEKISLIKNASLFLYPTQFEGFGLPPVEAMNLGCPVVVSSNSSMPEVCGDAAFYVNSQDENDIASGISEVLNNIDLRRKLIEAGFENARRFSWEKTTREHLTIFERVLNHQLDSVEMKITYFNNLFQKRGALD